MQITIQGTEHARTSYAPVPILKDLINKVVTQFETYTRIFPNAVGKYSEVVGKDWGEILGAFVEGGTMAPDHERGVGVSRRARQGARTF